MLVSKVSGITPGEISCFKLITGEEVIAKVITADDNKITVNEPLFLASTPDGPAFAPMLQLIADDANPIIYMRVIGMHYPPHKNVSNAYAEATSEILMPKKSAIIV